MVQRGSFVLLDDQWVGCEIGVDWESERNVRDHWRAKQRRKKAQNQAVSDALRLCRAEGLDPSRAGVVRMELLGTRAAKLDDDNAHAACKHVRDAIARFVGVDDGDSGWDWRPSGAFAHHFRGVRLWWESASI